MAGNSRVREENEELRGRVVELERECAELRKQLAVHAPHAAAGNMPEPLREYSDSICERVLAMGSAGMSEGEWVAALNVGHSTWEEWKALHPALMDACERAYSQRQAYWDGLAQKAIATNNNRFPMAIYKAIKDEKPPTTSAKGDASKLVMIDLRETATP